MCCTCMLWVIIYIEYKSLTHKQRFRWDRVMLQYGVIAGLINFALHLVQIPNFTIGKSPPNHNRASSMLYGWCDTGGGSSFTNSSPYMDPPFSNFDSSVYCLVFGRHIPLEHFDIVLLLQQLILP